jgi:hypothetical protein
MIQGGKNMKKELYDITLNERDFWLIMLALENQLVKISTRKKQGKKDFMKEYYEEQEIRINCLMDYLHYCIIDKNELDENLKKFLEEC